MATKGNGDSLVPNPVPMHNMPSPRKAQSGSTVLAALALCTVLSTPQHAWAQDAASILPNWVTYAGGLATDQVNSITTDGFGHVYVAGRTSDSLLLGNDTTGRSGFTHQRRYGGGTSDAFVAKYAPQGSMLWCTYFGGTEDDEAVKVVDDGLGGVYLVGNTTSQDSIATDTLSFQQSPGGGLDIFVAHFRGSGVLVGATYIGGSADERATGAALDVSGRLVVCAVANGPATLTGVPAPVNNWVAGNDGLLLLLSGTAQLSAYTYIGGEGDDEVVQVVQGDSTGTILAGNTTSLTGIATPGAMTPAAQGAGDVFLAKVDTNLAVIKATYFGGTGNDGANDLALHRDSLLVAGFSYSPELYTDSLSLQPVNAGQGDGFIALLDTAFQLRWSTFIGDTANDAAVAAVIDEQGNCYVASTRHWVTWDSLGAITPGVMLMRFDSSQAPTWIQYIGTADTVEAHAMAIKGFTSLYLGGRTNTTNNFPLEGHQMNYGGGPWDGFAARLDQKISTPSTGICTPSDGGGGGGGGADGGGGDQGNHPPQPVFDVCLGDSITFIVYGGALGWEAEWMWYVDTCGIPEQYLSTGDTLTIAPDHSFTLYVRAEGQDHVTLCSHAVIVVHDMPEPVITATDTVCAGAPVSFAGTGAETWAWLLGDSVVATGAQAQAAAPMQPGLAHFTAAATNGPACTVNVDVPVFVLPAPDVEWQVASMGCAGEPGMIALNLPEASTTDSAALSLAWQPATYSGPVLTGLDAGLYTATLTDTLNGCSRTDILEVVTPPTLTATWHITDVTCDGQPGSITLNLPDTAAMDSALVITWAQPGLFGPALDGLSPGIYVVTLADTLGCSRTDSLSVKLPPATMATWQVTNASCNNIADGQIAWLQPDTAHMDIAWADPDLQGPAVAGLSAGSYAATLTDTTGCSHSYELTVTAPAALMDSISTTAAFCGEAVGTAWVNSVSTSPGLMFDFGAGATTNSLVDHLPAGSYTVTATDSAGCSAQIAFVINTAGDIAVYIDADTLLAENGAADLSCYTVPANSPATFQWLPTTGLADPTSATTACTVAFATWYSVQAISPEGCTAMDSVLVIPWSSNTTPPAPPCADVFLPNIFSPNGDELNDQLCLFGTCIAETDWSILDRWGGSVFHARHVQDCWDGTRDGRALPPGSYLYVLHVLRTNGEMIERTGTITLKR